MVKFYNKGIIYIIKFIMKSLIVYTYFSSPSSDYNLDFFVKKELSYKDNIDYIIVINGYNYSDCIKFPELTNLQ